MKHISRLTRFGCLALALGFAAFLGILSLGILQESQTNGLVNPILSVTTSMTDEKPQPPTESAVTTLLPQDNGDNGALLVVTVAQLSLTNTPINFLLEPSPTAAMNISAGTGVRNAPATYPTTTPLSVTAYLPYFGGQTLDAQTSATAMLVARTAWYGNLTQGARDYAATMRVLGTPTGH